MANPKIHNNVMKYYKIIKLHDPRDAFSPTYLQVTFQEGCVDDLWQLSLGLDCCIALNNGWGYNVSIHIFYNLITFLKCKELTLDLEKPTGLQDTRWASLHGVLEGFKNWLK